MGHIPNETVDDVVPEPGVEENNVLPEQPRIDEDLDIPEFLDQFFNEHENHRHIPAIQELNHIFDPPPINLRYDYHEPAAVAHPQPHFPRGRILRPPPIGVRIPIIHRSNEASPEEFRIGVGYRVRCLPLRCVVNRPFSDRRRRVQKNIPPPTLPQLRFQKQPRMQVCLSRLSPQRRQIRGPRSPVSTSPRSICGRKSSNSNHHPHGGRPRPFHLTTHRRLSGSRLRRCGCKMNRVDLEVTLDNEQEVFKEEEEENDDDDDDYKCNECEAYKDLHYNSDSDDDDYSDDNALPNMQLLC